MDDRESLLSRLRRRKFVQWIVAYLAGAWVLYQVISLVGQNFAWPTVVLRVLTVLFGIGFVAAAIFAWYHGERGEQRVTAMDILGQVAEALEAAHRNGIVHRDLKPGNVIEDEATKRVLLADFGLAAILD